MIQLPTLPSLNAPTTAVETSYLVGEQADMIHRGSDTAWLSTASVDFEAYVAERVGVRERWGVPSELFWFTSGEYYIGSLVVRHRLTEDQGGGHIGYHVVYPWQRQGHATQMLRLGLAKCAALGIETALLTVEPRNAASIAVVRKNGGISDGVNHEGERRFLLETSGYR